MKIEKNKQPSYAIKFMASEKGKTVGRAYLYIIYNDLHHEPYGYLEDVFVQEDARQRGLGRALVEAVIAEAKKLGCYKLVSTSRAERVETHAWYEKRGFKKNGFRFRMDFK